MGNQHLAGAMAYFHKTSKCGSLFKNKTFPPKFRDIFIFIPDNHRKHKHRVVLRPNVTKAMALSKIGKGRPFKPIVPSPTKAQRSKKYNSRAANLSKKNALLRKMALREGAVLQKLVKAYVRDPNARQQCIDKYGPICFICNFSFKARYGKVADGFIHVHHVRQLSNIRKEHKVDPVKHLRPVCPNCHAVLHLKNRGYSIEKVKSFLRR